MPEQFWNRSHWVCKLIYWVSLTWRVLRVLIHEHGISFHLFRSLVSFSVLWLPIYNSYIPFIVNIFHGFQCFVTNGIVLFLEGEGKPLNLQDLVLPSGLNPFLQQWEISRVPYWTTRAFHFCILDCATSI